MPTLLIDIRDVTAVPVKGDTVTLTAPAPRPSSTGGVTRPFRRLVQLDADGRATVEVEPGPLRVIFHDGYGREVAIDTRVPDKGDTFTLRNLVVAEIGTVDDVPGVLEALDGKANTKHSHAIADVTGLQTALDGKANTKHSHAIADVTGLQTALDGKAAKSHRHTINDIDDLRWSLDQKVSASELESTVFDFADERIARLVDGAPEALDTLREVADEFKRQDEAIQAVFLEIGKRAMKSHTHAIADVTGLQAALDGKANTKHSHAIADVTGLQTALDGKAAKSHTHSSDDVTDARADLGQAPGSKLLKTRDDGQLWISTSSIVLNGHAVNKNYVDTEIKNAAPKSHTHTVGDVTGLQSALDKASRLPSTQSASGSGWSLRRSGNVVVLMIENWNGETFNVPAQHLPEGTARGVLYDMSTLSPARVVVYPDGSASSFNTGDAPSLYGEVTYIAKPAV